MFSGHSLRSGFLTSAAGKGASMFKMMDVSRHKSVDTLRGYDAMPNCSRITLALGCFEIVFSRPLLERSGLQSNITPRPKSAIKRHMHHHSN
jgi:hypothetical protein